MCQPLCLHSPASARGAQLARDGLCHERLQRDARVHVDELLRARGEHERLALGQEGEGKTPRWI